MIGRGWVNSMFSIFDSHRYVWRMRAMNDSSWIHHRRLTPGKTTNLSLFKLSTNSQKENIMSTVKSRNVLFVLAVVLWKSVDALYKNDMLTRHFLLCKPMTTKKQMVSVLSKIGQQYPTTVAHATSFTFACSVLNGRVHIHWPEQTMQLNSALTALSALTSPSERIDLYS
jgi:hypothetical protein